LRLLLQNVKGLTFFGHTVYAARLPVVLRSPVFILPRLRRIDVTWIYAAISPNARLKEYWCYKLELSKFVQELIRSHEKCKAVLLRGPRPMAALVFPEQVRKQLVR